MLEAALPAVYLAVAYDITAILNQKDPAYLDHTTLMVRLSMLVYIADRARASRHMEFMHQLPYYPAFREIHLVAEALIDSATKSKARSPVQVDRDEGHVDRQIVSLKLALGLRLSSSDLPTDLYPRDEMPEEMKKILDGDGGALLGQLRIMHQTSKPGERKHRRFWEKTTLVCLGCFKGDSQPDNAAEKSYKTAGCCQIITYCSTECAAAHWKSSHKAACWTRRK